MSNTQRRYDRDRDRRDERDRRDRDRQQARDERDAARKNRYSSVARRVGWVAGTCGVVALVISMTTGTGPKRPPAPDYLGSLSAKRVTEHVVDNAVVGAALAAERAVAAREGRPAGQRVSVTVVGNGTVTTVPSRANPGREGVTLRLAGVRSRDAHLTEEAATADAIGQAREQIGQQLALLDPPISRRPSFETVRDAYVFPKSARTVHPEDALKADWAKANLETNRVWVDIDVEVTPKQLQQLRGEERTVGVAKVVGAVVLVLLALAGFFRLDALTKGHFTGVLAAGGVALAALGGVAAVYFARMG